MKKIALYITLLFGVIYLHSCNINESPRFDDKDAFVGFTADRFVVKEDAGVFKLPVQLSSLDPKSTTVSFELIDGTAKASEDFNVKSGAAIVNFDGSEPVQHLELDILEHEGVFTGDKQFMVVISDAGSVDIGGNDTTFVVIQDLDHPLAAILGDYVGSGNDVWDDGPYSWSNVSFEKDADDVTKVWIVNAFAGYAITIKVYGVVNDDLTEISVPVNQALGTISGYNGLFAAAEPDPFTILPDGERLIFLIDHDKGVISLKEDLDVGVQAINPDTGVSAGWFERVYNLKYTRK